MIQLVHFSLVSGSTKRNGNFIETRKRHWLPKTTHLFIFTRYSKFIGLEIEWGTDRHTDLYCKFIYTFVVCFPGVTTHCVCIFTAQWRALASSFLRFLDHTQSATVGRNPLDEWSMRRREFYLTTHNTHNRQTSIPPVVFEPTVSASERPKTYALDRAATGTGKFIYIRNLIFCGWVCACILSCPWNYCRDWWLSKSNYLISGFLIMTFPIIFVH
jgi:hypothetical protein